MRPTGRLRSPARDQRLLIGRLAGHGDVFDRTYWQGRNQGEVMAEVAAGVIQRAGVGAEKLRENSGLELDPARS